MFAVDFELRPADLGATAVVLAATLEAALERAFQLFPEYLRDGCQGHVHEIEGAVINWETGRALVMKRKMGNRKPRRMADAARVKEAQR
jgi:hypothetical protein